MPELKIHYLTERLLFKNLIAENETEIFDEIIREYLAEYDAVDAVSYTHLDVYKRQIKGWYCCSNSLIFFCLMNCKVMAIINGIP